eukprot:CAMPEP_0115045936 /NCGR_PEP_ID=MMETSP0216-20121206/48466_1 /TAXON_ID=223996 /ORGANISM="Protocruzia adherens, Strain Boccale" /LENGTH=1289 /DNA_ID=CAMNT_0002428953 /DNA_START=373 /DNA_END=4242 /DNA_ORIENTATION=-
MEKKGQVSELNYIIEQAEEKNSNLYVKIDGQKKEIEELKKEVTVAEDKLKECRGTLKEKNAQIKKLQDLMNFFESEKIKELLLRLDELTKEKQLKSNECTSLKSELRKAREENTLLKSELCNGQSIFDGMGPTHRSILTTRSSDSSNTQKTQKSDTSGNPSSRKQETRIKKQTSASVTASASSKGLPNARSPRQVSGFTPFKPAGSSCNGIVAKSGKKSRTPKNDHRLKKFIFEGLPTRDEREVGTQNNSTLQDLSMTISNSNIGDESQKKSFINDSIFDTDSKVMIQTYKDSVNHGDGSHHHRQEGEEEEEEEDEVIGQDEQFLSDSVLYEDRILKIDEEPKQRVSGSSGRNTTSSLTTHATQGTPNQEREEHQQSKTTPKDSKTSPKTPTSHQSTTFTTSNEIQDRIEELKSNRSEDTEPEVPKTLIHEKSSEFLTVAQSARLVGRPGVNKTPRSSSESRGDGVEKSCMSDYSTVNILDENQDEKEDRYHDNRAATIVMDIHLERMDVTVGTGTDDNGSTTTNSKKATMICKHGEVSDFNITFENQDYGSELRLEEEEVDEDTEDDGDNSQHRTERVNNNDEIISKSSVSISERNYQGASNDPKTVSSSMSSNAMVEGVIIRMKKENERPSLAKKIDSQRFTFGVTDSPRENSRGLLKKESDNEQRDEADDPIIQYVNDNSWEEGSHIEGISTVVENDSKSIIKLGTPSNKGSILRLDKGSIVSINETESIDESNVKFVSVVCNDHDDDLVTENLLTENFSEDSKDSETSFQLDSESISHTGMKSAELKFRESLDGKNPILEGDDEVRLSYETGFGIDNNGHEEVSPISSKKSLKASVTQDDTVTVEVRRREISADSHREVLTEGNLALHDEDGHKNAEEVEVDEHDNEVVDDGEIRDGVTTMNKVAEFGQDQFGAEFDAIVDDEDMDEDLPSIQTFRSEVNPSSVQTRMRSFVSNSSKSFCNPASRKTKVRSQTTIVGHCNQKENDPPRLESTSAVGEPSPGRKNLTALLTEPSLSFLSPRNVRDYFSPRQMFASHITKHLLDNETSRSINQSDLMKQSLNSTIMSTNDTSMSRTPSGYFKVNRFIYNQSPDSKNGTPGSLSRAGSGHLDRYRVHKCDREHGNSPFGFGDKSVDGKSKSLSRSSSEKVFLKGTTGVKATSGGHGPSLGVKSPRHDYVKDIRSNVEEFKRLKMDLTDLETQNGQIQDTLEEIKRNPSLLQQNEQNSLTLKKVIQRCRDLRAEIKTITSTNGKDKLTYSKELMTFKNDLLTENDQLILQLKKVIDRYG